MRLRYCLIACITLLFGLSAPLCALACSFDSGTVQAHHDAPASEAPCHDRGESPDSGTHSEDCEDDCLGLAITASAERTVDHSSPGLSPGRDSQLTLIAQPPSRPEHFGRRPGPLPPTDLLLLKSTLLI